MRLKFPQAERITEVRSHSERASFILELKRLAVEERGVVFLDQGLGPQWRHKLIGFGIPAKQIVLSKSGEAAKSWKLVGAALELLSRRAHERSAPVIAIGGGATCDAVALIASLYRRGVPLVLVPTTLLAMVDASVGGKTAVDLNRGGKLYKNVAGTFYPAHSVELWSGWLATLPKQEKISGLGELLKMLWIAGVETKRDQFHRWVEGEENEDALWPFIEKAVATKIAIVEKDPLDTLGVRSLLNYGHTLGHALESLSKGKLTHGEAVALGMLAESSFAKADKKFIDYLTTQIFDRGYILPKNLKGISASSLIPLLRNDKKLEKGRLKMDVLTGIGKHEQVLASPMELAKFAAEWSKL